MEEMFDSAVRTTGDLAGVFEYDGETGCFYLYATGKKSNRKVLDAIHVSSGELDFVESDVSVRWDLGEQKVGLFIRKVLWAVFDLNRRAKYGGDYKSGARPAFSSGIESGF